MEARILRLNIAGQPIEWLLWKEAVCLYARDLVQWTLGGQVRRVWGGHSRLTGLRTHMDLPAIIACGTSASTAAVFLPKTVSPGITCTPSVAVARIGGTMWWRPVDAVTSTRAIVF